MQREWNERARSLRNAIRRHLWDPDRAKFKPHVYLAGSPFPPDFDEAEKSSRLSGAIRGLRSVAGRVLGRVANLRQIGIGVRWPSPSRSTGRGGP